MANIRKVTGWSGTKTFDIVLYAVGEGKSFRLDYFTIYTGFSDEFINPAFNGWTASGATMVLNNGAVTITENSPGTSYGNIQASTCYNVDVNPEVAVIIDSIEPGASWSLKANDGSGDKDIILNSIETGVIRADLKGATGWSGVKSITMKLYVAGEGKSVKVDRIDVPKDHVRFQESVAALLGSDYKVVSADEAIAAGKLMLQQGNAGWTENFDSASNWTNESANLSISNGIATIRDMSGGNPYGSVKSSAISLNVDTYPRIYIKTNTVESNCNWVVKVSDGGADIDLMANEEHPGIYMCELKNKTGWSGTKTFNIRLYAVGDQKAFTVDWIKVK